MKFVGYGMESAVSTFLEHAAIGVRYSRNPARDSNAMKFKTNDADKVMLARPEIQPMGLD